MTLDPHLALVLLTAFQSTLASRPAEQPVRQYAEAFPDLFLPYFEHTKKSLAEWMAEFQRTKSSDALWCIYYKGDRSPAVVDVLSAMERTTLDRRVRSDLETILTHWNVPLPLRYASGTRPSLLEIEPRAGVPDDDLVDSLSSPIRHARTSSALALVYRQREVERALRVLWADAVTAIANKPHTDSQPAALDDASERAFRRACALAGSPAQRIALTLLRDPASTTDSLRFTLRYVWPDTSSRSAWIDALIGIADRNAPVREQAIVVLLAIAGFHDADGIFWDFESGFANDTYFHQPFPSRSPLELPGEAAVASYFARRLARGIDDDSIAVDEMQRIGAVAFRSDDLRPIAMREIRRFLHKQSPDPRVASRDPRVDCALALLCHFGVSDDDVHERYVTLLDSIDPADKHDLSRVPCLRRHTAATLATFERLYRNAHSKVGLFAPLMSGGLLDTARSWMARDLATHLDDEMFGCWCAVLAFPCSMHWDTIGPEANSANVQKLALTLRAKRTHNRSFEVEERRLLAILRAGYHENSAGGCADYYKLALSAFEALGIVGREFKVEAFRVLGDRQSFSSHRRAAAQALASSDMSREEQAILGRLDWFDPDGCESLFVKQGESAIEFVGALREDAHREAGAGREPQSQSAFECIFRITRPSRIDVQFLVLFLAHGAATDRHWSLRMIRDHAIDAPEIRAAVTHAVDDCDEPTAALAKEIVKARGW